MRRFFWALVLTLAIVLEVVGNTICLFSLVLLPLLLAGCPRPIQAPPAPVCVPGASQCMGDAEHVEVCDSRGQWVRTRTCAPVDGVRTYCADGPNGAACVPSEVP